MTNFQNDLNDLMQYENYMNDLVDQRLREVNLNDVADQGLFNKWLSQDVVGYVKRGETGEMDDVLKVEIELKNGKTLKGWQIVPKGKGLFHEMLDCPLLLQEPQGIQKY